MYHRLFQKEAAEKNQGMVLRFTSCKCCVIAVMLEIAVEKIVTDSF